jgi:hypothetical protein
MLHFPRRAAATALTTAVMKRHFRHFNVNISAISTAIYSTAAALIIYSYAVVPITIGGFNYAGPFEAVRSAAAVTCTTVTGKAVAGTELCCYFLWLSLHSSTYIQKKTVETTKSVLASYTQHAACFAEMFSALSKHT